MRPSLNLAHLAGVWLPREARDPERELPDQIFLTYPSLTWQRVGEFVYANAPSAAGGLTVNLVLSAPKGHNVYLHRVSIDSDDSVARQHHIYLQDAGAVNRVWLSPYATAGISTMNFVGPGGIYVPGAQGVWPAGSILTLQRDLATAGSIIRIRALFLTLPVGEEVSFP